MISLLSMRNFCRLPINASLSDIAHGDDDTIEARARLLTADGSDGGPRTLVEAVVISAFWADAVVADYDQRWLDARSDDLDALVVAIFAVLGAQIREYGTEHVSACYPDFRGFLADHLPPATAARLDASLCRAMPAAAEDRTITFSV